MPTPPTRPIFPTALQPTGSPGRTPVAVIGGGPAGLMAAEALALGGAAVTLLDHMPSVGRKLLIAGRGGLNLTHAEPLPGFLRRYGAAAGRLEPAIRGLPPAALIAWCHGLGQDTFVGSGGRVFPRALKASPLKRIALRFGAATVRGEATVTAAGIEGGAVYALAADLREAIAAHGPVILHLDLRPDVAEGALASRLDGPRGGLSLANYLRRAGLPPVAIGLVQEALHAGEAVPLSRLVKALPLRLLAPTPIARAISSAGGITWEEVDRRFMLARRPGVFVAGEMLDWEAPTGGWLLQACFATGAAAGRGALEWLAEQP